MMPYHFARLVALLRLQIAPEQVWAMQYLEDRGLRFLVHFGADNAVQKAADHYVATLTRRLS